MAHWFFRIGGEDYTERYNTARYRDLADPHGHSLIMIGFGIDKDITGRKKREDVKKYLINDRGESGRSMSSRAGRIHTFMNKVAIGDTIISPFGANTTNIKIGKVKSDCKAVNAFLTAAEINAFLARHPLAKDPQDIEFKPARKIDWGKTISESDFRNSYGKEAKKLRLTITFLK